MEINHQYLFHVLPEPVLVINSLASIVALNAAATDIFPLFHTGYNLNEAFVEKNHLKNIILQLLHYRQPVVKIVYIKTSAGSVKPFTLKSTILSDTNQLYMLILSDIDSNKQLIIQESQRLIKDEFGKLSPYLNKAGKNLLEQKLSKGSLNQLIEVEFMKQFDKELMTKINRSFEALGIPLTENELNLCYCMYLNLNVIQMANVLQKNPNAVRVQQFRLVNKTNFNSVKYLKEFIQSIK